MTLADTQIRIGVIAKLQSVLPGIAIRDYVALPTDVLPYVILGTQTVALEENIKMGFGTQSTLLIQVMGKRNLTVSRAEVENMANTIMHTIITDEPANYITVAGFSVVNTRLDSLNDDVVKDNDGILARKLIRIRFFLREN